MAEWLKAPVLKTGNGQPFVGSNPTPSAILDVSTEPLSRLRERAVRSAWRGTGRLRNAFRNGAFGFFRQGVAAVARLSRVRPALSLPRPPQWTRQGEQNAMTIRVFLVDDHALVRVGMRMILSGETDIKVVGEAESGEEALPQIRKLKPNVVLCDLHLPGVSGLEITERIVKGRHGTRVIVVSVLEDGPMPKRVIEAGASGYVGKGGSPAELLNAVREVARGRRFLASGVAQNLALSGLGGGGSPFDVLSPRELEVVMLLLQGLRQEDIAKRLSLSAKTVNTHKSRLFGKLAVQDNISLARLASQYGLVDPAQLA